MQDIQAVAIKKGYRGSRHGLEADLETLHAEEIDVVVCRIRDESQGRLKNPTMAASPGRAGSIRVSMFFWITGYA